MVGNAVFLLREHPVVVRIVLAPSFSYRADNVVRAARWLREHGVPVVRPLPGLSQPVRVGEHLATFWEEVPEGARELDGTDLGRLLTKMHQTPVLDSLPSWQPVDDVRRRLDDAEALSRQDRDFLAQRCDDLEERLENVKFALPTSVVHGDAHLGNVISGSDEPVLCDLDSVCIGPPECDLAATAVGCIRMGHPQERHEKLAEEYGFDVTRWSGFPVLRELRELKIVVGALPTARSNPQLQEQLHLRLRSIRSGDTGTRWTAYR